MAIDIKNYVRNPLYVEAVQVTKENFSEILVWCHGTLFWSSRTPGDDDLEEVRVTEETEGKFDPKHHCIRIRVHNPQSPRQTRAFVGDWILYTKKGYKIYPNKAFKDNFKLVEDE